MSYLLLLVTLIFSFLNCVQAQSLSGKIAHAGRLVDTSGVPTTGQVDLRFELYYSGDTSTSLCAVEHSSVSLTNGIYHVELDFSSGPESCDLNEVIEDIPASESLVVQVHDTTNGLSYDFQNIVSVPMAFHSRYAEQAGSVADGSITSEKLDQMGADSGEALIWDGTQWAPGQAGEAGTVTSVNAGDGLSVTDPENDPTLEVNVDDTTIEIMGDTLQVKDGGITSAKIGDGEVIASKIPFHASHFNDNAGVLELLFSPTGGIHADPIIGLSLGVDGSTIELSGGNLQVRDGGVGDDQLASGIDAGKLTIGTLDSERLDTGTGANQIVQVGADGNLPALDGRNLINLPAVETQDTLCADGEYLQASGGSFTCTSAGSGDGDFMSDGSVSMSGDLDIDSNDILNASSLELINSEDNTLSLRLPATGVADYQIVFPSQLGAEGEVLVLNSAGELEWTELDTGEIESGDIAAGAIDDSHISASANIAQSKVAGLEDDLDATLLIDGTRAMTNDLDLGTNNIVNVGTVDGIDLPSLASSVSDNESDIATNAGDILANAAAISSNADAISNLDTDDVVEATNLYFTDERAQDAAVVDSTAGSETDQAPSVSAIKAYISDELDGLGAGDLLSDGSVAMSADFDLAGNNLSNVDTLNLVDDSDNAIGLRSPASGVTPYQIVFPSQLGAVGEVLVLNSAGELEWTELDSGEIESGDIAAGAIDNSHISATAEIAQSKIAGLLDDLDDLLLLDGTRAMSGDLDMGTQNIINVGTVDGVNISDLSSTVSDNQTDIASKQDDLNIPNDATLYLDGNGDWQTLNTDAVAEATNLYFTDERAQEAAVVDSTAGNEIDQAPSVAAMKSYLSDELSSASGDYLLLDGSQEMEGTLNLGENNLRFENPTHSIEFQAPATIIDNYTLTLPQNEGTSGQVLSSDGTGVLSWVSPEEGTVTEVSGTGPISVSDGTTTPEVSISQASDSSDGYLSSDDWDTFNSKQDALTTGNLTESTSSVLTITGGDDSVIGSGVGIEVTQADGGSSGYLSSTDWNTFNNKQDSIGIDSANTTDFLDRSGNWRELASADIPDAEALNTQCADGEVLVSDGSSFQCLDSTLLSQWEESGGDIYYDSGRVGIGTSLPNSSAALDVSATDKGFLPPRLTTAQRAAIATPSDGLIVYDTDEEGLFIYKLGEWAKLADSLEVAFRATQTSTQSIPEATWTDLNFHTTTFDTNGFFNTSTNRFEPTIAGYYWISGSTRLDHLDGARAGYLRIRKNGSSMALDIQYARQTSSTVISLDVGEVIYLNGDGDYVDMQTYHNSPSSPATNISYTSFSGFLISGGTGGSTGGSDNLGNHVATQNIAMANNWLSGDGDDEGIWVDSDGNVGVGIDTPSSKLEVAGTITASGFEGDGSGLTGITGASLADGTITLDKTDFGSGDGIFVPQQSSPPADPSAGQMYYNSGDNRVYVYNGDTWTEVGPGSTGVIPRSWVQYDDVSRSYGTSFADGPTFSPVTIRDGFDVDIEYHIPARNDATSGWGGGYVEIQYSLNGGAWTSLGSSGYQLAMIHSVRSINTHSQMLRLTRSDLGDVVGDFDINFKFRYRSYSDTLLINQSSGTSDTKFLTTLKISEVTDNNISTSALMSVNQGTVHPAALGDNFAIGLDSSDARLSVKGAGSDDILNVFDSADNDVLTILNDGKVGIGTMAPAVELDVQGAVRAVAFDGDGSDLTGIGTSSIIDGAITADKIADGAITLDKTDFGSSDGIFIPQQASAPADPSTGQMYYSTGDDKIYVYTGSSWTEVGSGSSQWVESGDDISFSEGKVGIGTAAPTTSLDVAGSFRLGDGGEECDSTTEGALRYNSTSQRVNFCDGQQWQSLGGGGLDSLFHVRDEKPSGTQGGSSSAGVWQTRDLNTVMSNEIPGASLSGNQITLPPGKYMIMARAPGYRIEYHQARLHDVVADETLIVGSSQYSGNTTNNVVNDSVLRGKLNLESSKTFELQHQSSGSMSTYGLGLRANMGLPEVYSEILIWKAAPGSEGGESIWENEASDIFYTEGSVGIGTDSPAEKLDVAGNIKIGNSGDDTCDGTNEGSVRYNSTTKKMEFCDGSDWFEFAKNPNIPKITSAQISTGEVSCATTLPSMTFEGEAGQRVEITATQQGRPVVTTSGGHFYNQLFLNGTLVDSGGTFTNTSWRSQVVTNYSGVLSSSGTHTVHVYLDCGNGTTAIQDGGGEWPNGGLHYRVIVSD